MFHKMRLNNNAYMLMKNNLKTIELRLNDEKRRKIKVGDLIEFINSDSLDKQYVQVVKLHYFESFKELYENIDLSKCGYLTLENITHEDMLVYYSPLQQKKYGVIGIEIELLSILIEPVKKISKHLTDEEITLKLKTITQEDKEKGYVPAYKYDIYLFNTDIKIGFIDIRLGYNENIIYGGNIGYAIYEEYRGNKYAKKACLLIFDVAKAYKMTKLFISCSPNNIPSKKTIENLGFKLIRKAKLPSYNEMYLLGDREKLIYELSIT